MKKLSPVWPLILLPFILGLIVALTEPISKFERSVFDLIQKLPNAFYKPLFAVTKLGDALGVIVVTALVLVISIVTKNFFKVGLPVVLTVIISRIVNVAFKNIIDRERPEFKVFSAGESSFPSGHAQNNMALYLAILLALLLVVRSPKLSLFLKIFLIGVPVLIGITRVYFGVHYVSDVVAGWSLGAFVAMAVYTVYFKLLSERMKLNADRTV